MAIELINVDKKLLDDVGFNSAMVYVWITNNPDVGTIAEVQYGLGLYYNAAKRACEDLAKAGYITLEGSSVSMA
jgi:hypothetical protein